MSVKVKLVLKLKRLAWIRQIHLPAMFLTGFLTVGAVLWAQPETADTPPAPGVFRIGYLRGDPEAAINGLIAEKLRLYLKSLPAVLGAMQQEGIEDIIVQASDSHESLRDWWMSQNQIDLAFCSAVDFVLQRGDYQPLFQLRGHSYSTSGNPHFHRGVIFVNNRSSFFTSELPVTVLGRALANRQIAMVGHSAAGYFYPSLKLARMTTSNTLPSRPIFCASSEEAVKYVISGITEAGACEKAVLEQVLHQHGLKQSEVVRVIMETDLIPTDPVAIHEKWLPRKSPMGREVKKALREFFRRPEHGLPRLEDTSVDNYAAIRENLKKFQSLTQRGS